MRVKRPAHATVIAYLALFFALGGTAYAATGGTFLLGRSNAATSPTTLTNSAGTPLALNAKAGYAPLGVNSTTKVGRLNSDLLDGWTPPRCSAGWRRHAPRVSRSARSRPPAQSPARVAPPGPGRRPRRQPPLRRRYHARRQREQRHGLRRGQVANVGDVLLSGGFHQPFQAQAHVQGSFPENYLVVTAEHSASWAVQYQGLPNTETLDVYAICQHAA